MRWPWARHTQQPLDDDTAFEQERHALTRDIEQIKHVNEYLLAKAVARGWLSNEEASAIRVTQAYHEGVLKFGRPDLQPPG